MLKENDLQMQYNVFLKECNGLYSYKFESIQSKLQHSSTGKSPIFFLKINNRGVGIKLSWVEKFRKINNSGGQLIRTRK